MSLKLFHSNQIKAWDKATIDKGIESIQLMERAAEAMCERLLELFDPEVKIIILAGPGNNGGDALAIARLLLDHSFQDISVFLFSEKGKPLSQNTQLNANRINHNLIGRQEDMLLIEQALRESDLLLDGLFGSGFKGELNGIFKEIVELVNDSDVPVISIDIPSGMPADGTEPVRLSMISDHVLTLQIPKRAFLFPSAQEWMDDFEIIDIGLDPDFADQAPCELFFIQEEDIKLPQRNKFDHKGKFGPALVIVGSMEMIGAAQLCCAAALNSGVGVLHASIPSEAAHILLTSLPELIIQARDESHLQTVIKNLEEFKAIACGPGLGESDATRKLVNFLLNNCKHPLVLDADALNIIAHEHWHNLIPKGSIITPHVKEFERLFGSFTSDWDRLSEQRSRSVAHGIVIVLKGAHTSVSLPDGSLYFNSSGNPLMATPGSGDVLCGLILSLLAQGHNSKEAAISGVFLHGQAGDRAAAGRWAMRSSDIISELGYY